MLEKVETFKKNFKWFPNVEIEIDKITNDFTQSYSSVLQEKIKKEMKKKNFDVELISTMLMNLESY